MKKNKFHVLQSTSQDNFIALLEIYINDLESKLKESVNWQFSMTTSDNGPIYYTALINWKE